MRNRKLVRLIVAGVVFLCLFGAQMVLVEQWRAIQAERDREVLITQEVLRLERLIADVDNGFRGYVLMKQSMFLEPMVAAEAKIPGVLARFGEMTEHWPELQRDVATLQQRITEFLETKRRLSVDLSLGKEEEVLAFIRGGEGVAMAKTIALAVQDVEQRIDQRRRDRKQNASQGTDWVGWSLALTAAAWFLFGVGTGRWALHPVYLPVHTQVPVPLI